MLVNILLPSKKVGVRDRSAPRIRFVSNSFRIITKEYFRMINAWDDGGGSSDSFCEISIFLEIASFKFLLLIPILESRTANLIPLNPRAVAPLC
ncbi:MAG: hypothetical protein WCD18_06030 [Thermosynechococcaceae cyanobacterium]